MPEADANQDRRAGLSAARRLLLESRRLVLAETLREDPALVEHRDKLRDAHAELAALPWHAVDDARCEVVCIEAPPTDAEWAGVNDRLRRAAHPA